MLLFFVIFSSLAKTRLSITKKKKKGYTQIRRLLNIHFSIATNGWGGRDGRRNLTRQQIIKRKTQIQSEITIGLHHYVWFKETNKNKTNKTGHIA